MMASSQGTQPSKMKKRGANLAFIEACRSLTELWVTENRLYGSSVKKADVANIQQTTAYLYTLVTHPRRHRTYQKKKKLTNLMGNLCCAREQSFVSRAVFLHS
jgi:hypothetical protein